MSQPLVIDDLVKADALLAQGRLEPAVVLLERLAFMNPEDGSVWERLTGALIGAGEYERAAITSFAYEALAPSPRAYLMRSQALLHVEPHEALAPALSAQAAEPTNWSTHAQVARCHLIGLDAAGKGLAAALHAVELAGTQAQAHAVLALAYRRHERYEEAERAAGRALSLDPRNQEAKDVLQALTLLTPGRGAAVREPRTSRTVSVQLVVFALILALLVPASILVLNRFEPILVGVLGLTLICVLYLLARLRTSHS